MSHTVIGQGYYMAFVYVQDNSVHDQQILTSFHTKCNNSPPLLFQGMDGKGHILAWLPLLSTQLVLVSG